MLLMNDQPEEGMHVHDVRINFLTAMMIQRPQERETILKELLLRLIQGGQHRKALDELELYLPSLPYQDNPVLHIYAGLLCLYLAQPKTVELVSGGQGEDSWNPSLLRDAQSHLERAKALDPDNTVATTFLDKLPTIVAAKQRDDALDSDDDGADTTSGDGSQRRKRTRT